MFRKADSKGQLHNTEIYFCCLMFSHKNNLCEATIYQLYVYKQITVLLRMFFRPYIVTEPGPKLIFYRSVSREKKAYCLLTFTHHISSKDKIE